MNANRKMMVRSGSCLLAGLMTVAGALFVVHAAPAAPIDTTGGTTVLNLDNPANTYIGNGVLQVSDDGSGLIELDTNGNTGVTNFVMTGGSMIIDSGVTFRNGGWQKGVWTGNLASLNVGGTFDIWDGNTVFVDALTGSGTITKGYGGGTAFLEIGVNSGSGTFSGVIQNPEGNVTLIKHGGGTQTLSGPQIAYTGDTTVHVGTLVLSGATGYASATTAAHAPGGGTLELHSTNPGVDNWRINTVLTGAGTINKTGTGWIQTSTNAHNFSGTFNIQEGTFGASYLSSNWTGVTADFHIAPGAVLDARGQAITVGSLNGGGTVGNTWSSTATLNVGAGNKSGVFSGIIHGTGTGPLNNPADPNAGLLDLVKTGTGTQTLSGNNTFAGNVTVNGGTLRGSAPNAFGAANSARTITVNSGATLEFNQVGMYGGHNSTTVPHLVVNAGGTVSNASLNNPLNNVTLNGGTLTATASNGGWRSWNINGTITSSGNSFITGGTAPDPGIMLQSAAVSNTNINVTGGNLVVSAPIVNGRFGTNWPEVASSLTKLGDGVLYLDGNNSYSGNTHVNAGYLVARHNNALGATGNSYVAAGATLQLENNITVAGETAHIVGDGVGGTRGALANWSGNNTWGGPVVLTGHSRILVNSGSMQINNTISESAAGSNLLKTGGGALTLGGANTYGGTTNVTAGTLLVNGTHTGGGMYTVQATPGGTATLGGTGTIGGTVTIGSGGIHAPGASVGEQTVGDAVWNPGGAFEFEINDATGQAGLTAGGWDLLTISPQHGDGTLDISGLTAGSFRIDIVSLDGATPGSLANFIVTEPRTWEFVTYDTLLGEFDPGLFDLNVGPFTAHNSLGAGYFEIVQTAGGLAIGFVPEPGAALLLLSAVACGLLLRRRK